MHISASPENFAISEPAGCEETKENNDKGNSPISVQQNLRNPEVSKSGFLNLSTIDAWSQITLCCGAVLWGLTGCSAATLASTYWMPVTSPLSCGNQECLQTLLHVSGGGGWRAQWARLRPTGLNLWVSTLSTQKHHPVACRKVDRWPRSQDTLIQESGVEPKKLRL